jgi:hypothetical protein
VPRSRDGRLFRATRQAAEEPHIRIRIRKRNEPLDVSRGGSKYTPEGSNL